MENFEQFSEIIPKIFLDEIDDLAIQFAKKMSGSKEGRCATICYNNTYDCYRSIALFLYCFTQKLSWNKSSFVNNNILAKIFYNSFSRLYAKRILTDLEEHKIFKINHKFCPTSAARERGHQWGFSKSYLLHWDMSNKIKKQKGRWECKMETVILPKKVTNVFLKYYKNLIIKTRTIDEDEQYFLAKQRLDNQINEVKKNEEVNSKIDPNFLTTKNVKLIEWIPQLQKFIDKRINQKKHFSKKELKQLYEINEVSKAIKIIGSKEEHLYKYLDYDDESLKKWCRGDTLEYMKCKKKIDEMFKDPLWVKGRYYHAFHQFPHKFREKVLRFKGMKLVEVFDIPAADLHTLAKILEVDPETSYYQKTLKEFELDVLRDFRKDFGTRKKDGKCLGWVKRAFKIYLNLQSPGKYDHFRTGKIVQKINNYFEKKYPAIQSFIRNHNDIWLESAKREFKIMSDYLFHNLAAEGIPAFTVHDAVYVPEVFVPYLTETNLETGSKRNRITKMFYQSLQLRYDQECFSNLFEL